MGSSRKCLIPWPDMFPRTKLTPPRIKTTLTSRSRSGRKVWGAKIDDGEYVNSVDWKKKNMCPNGIHVQYVEYNVTDNDVQRFRTILRTFRYKAATAHDKIPSRILNELEDYTLRHFICLYKRCEASGDWPSQWKDATMIMIPKAEQFKWRLIALLVTPYRVWAREAGNPSVKMYVDS